MIDVRILRKPKATATTTATSSITYVGTTAGEVAKAAKADLATLATEAKHALKADQATTAGAADEATHANEADHTQAADEATHATAADQANQAKHAESAYTLDEDSPIHRQYLSRLNDDTAEGNIHFQQTASSPKFTTGFDGEGWAIQPTTPTNHGASGTYLEVDNLRVRNTMSVYELVIERVRAICGSLGISQACGKVDKVTHDATNYYLTLEGDDTHGYGGFQPNDIIRCQRWTQNGVKGYWVKINEVNGPTLTIDRQQFDATIAQQGNNYPADQVNTNQKTQLQTPGGNTLASSTQQQTITSLNGKPLILTTYTILTTGQQAAAASLSPMIAPAAGDEIIQYGNTTDTTRQSAVFIHADETGRPAIDILQGINTTSFAGCITVRLGAGLPTSANTDTPTDAVGLYTKNGHIISINNNKQTAYEFRPDGTFTLAAGAITYDNNKLTLSSDITLAWSQITNTDTITNQITNAQTTAEAAKATAEAAVAEATQAATAAIPDYVKDWNTNATTITATTIATPQAAIGTKNTDGKFTGIVIGNNPSNTTQGYALAAYQENEPKVIIDPATETYAFKGKIIATEGQFYGMTYGSVFKSITYLTADTFNTYIQQYTQTYTPQLSNTTRTRTIHTPNFYNASTIIIIQTIPEDTGNPEEGQNPELNLYLPPYYFGKTNTDTGIYKTDSNNITRPEDYLLALSLLGTTFVVINQTTGDTTATINLYCKNLPTGTDTIQTTPITSIKAIALTLKLSTDGTFYWEYHQFTPDDTLTIQGTPQPMTPFTTLNPGQQLA